MNALKRKNGEILTISMIFIAIAITVFIFVLAIFMSHINTILYNFKIDMYTLNKSAVISINKGRTSIDDFSYNSFIYKEEFVKELKRNYDLDENLENKNKLISNVEIVEYEVYEENKRDSYSKKRCDGRTVHTVVQIKIKPIILANFLEDIFTFTIHEDVALNSMIMDKK